ncbi:site-specific recombinase XerD [Frankia sp. EI5c]|uniref:site-specific integrase n=1 Tax=Frankia sp. EI5c TaxID=683316 RepID=UPI0007C20A67|nr:site-specific integrase [Frankia sp. EI5c]OAA29255.1 site-specific recombinase XerD [Frankia sp. EI5c]
MRPVVNGRRADGDGPVEVGSPTGAQAPTGPAGTPTVPAPTVPETVEAGSVETVERVTAAEVVVLPAAGGGGLGVLGEELAGRVGDYARASRSAATWRAYDADLRHFRSWCAGQPLALVAVPASAATVAGYIAALADAGYAPSTIRRRLAAISVAHQLAQVDNPTGSAEVSAVWNGIRRSRGVRPSRKAALDTSLLSRVVAGLDDAVLADVRDRALLLVGFAGCLRRSELVGLDTADVVETDDGLVLTVRRSKTDQEAAGAQVGLAYGSYRPTCPVRAWRGWVAAAAAAGMPLAGGPAFRGINRHGQVGAGRLYAGSVARIVQRRVAAAGLDPADFAGHSLRSGFATAAARAGVTDRSIMRQGRWRSAASLESYVRAGRLFDADNPSGRVGL